MEGNILGKLMNWWVFHAAKAATLVTASSLDVTSEDQSTVLTSKGGNVGRMTKACKGQHKG